MSVQEAIAVQVAESDYITFSYEHQIYRYKHPGLDSACRVKSDIGNNEDSYILPFIPRVLLYVFVDIPDFIISMIDTFIQVVLMFPEKDTSMPNNDLVFKGCVYYQPSNAVLQFKYEVRN